MLRETILFYRAPPALCGGRFALPCFFCTHTDDPPTFLSSSCLGKPNPNQETQKKQKNTRLFPPPPPFSFLSTAPSRRAAAGSIGLARRLDNAIILPAQLRLALFFSVCRKQKHKTLFPPFSVVSPFYHFRTTPPPITEREGEAFFRVVGTLFLFGRECKQNKLDRQRTRQKERGTLISLFFLSPPARHSDDAPPPPPSPRRNADMRPRSRRGRPAPPCRGRRTGRARAGVPMAPARSRARRLGVVVARPGDPGNSDSHCNTVCEERAADGAGERGDQGEFRGVRMGEREGESQGFERV